MNECIALAILLTYILFPFFCWFVILGRSKKNVQWWNPGAAWFFRTVQTISGQTKIFLLLHVGRSEYTIFCHCEVELWYWTGFTCWYYSYFSIACYTFDISFCYVFYHSKPLLFKYILFLFFLVSAVACESGKMEELCEVELWHWRVCTWIYGSSLAWFGLLERFSLVLLCFVCIYG